MIRLVAVITLFYCLLVRHEQSVSVFINTTLTNTRNHFIPISFLIFLLRHFAFDIFIFLFEFVSDHFVSLLLVFGHQIQRRAGFEPGNLVGIERVVDFQIDRLA